jgi:hypothetical protein
MEIKTPFIVGGPTGSFFPEVDLRVADWPSRKRVIGRLGFLFRKLDLTSRMY